MEWRAFDGVHGLDDIRHELQFARFAAFYASTKGSKATPLDFCVFRKKRRQTEDEMLATLDSAGK